MPPFHNTIIKLKQQDIYFFFFYIGKQKMKTRLEDLQLKGLKLTQFSFNLHVLLYISLSSLIRYCFRGTSEILQQLLFYNQKIQNMTIVVINDQGTTNIPSYQRLSLDWFKASNNKSKTQNICQKYYTLYQSILTTFEDISLERFYFL